MLGNLRPPSVNLGIFSSSVVIGLGSSGQSLTGRVRQMMTASHADTSTCFFLLIFPDILNIGLSYILCYILSFYIYIYIYILFSLVSISDPFHRILSTCAMPYRALVLTQACDSVACVISRARFPARDSLPSDWLPDSAHLRPLHGQSGYLRLLPHRHRLLSTPERSSVPSIISNPIQVRP